MAGRSAIDLTFQMESLDLVRKKLADMEKKAPSVQANALNQTQTVLKNYLPKQVQKKYTYRVKAVKPSGKPQRASIKNLVAKLFYNRKDPGLENFDFSRGTIGAPRNSPGSQLAARVKSSGGLKDISRAFAMKTGSKTIIMRRDASARVPISRVFGPSEHNMINSVWESPESQQYASKMLAEKLDAQIHTQFLKKWGMSTKEAKNYLAGRQ